MAAMTNRQDHCPALPGNVVAPPARRRERPFCSADAAVPLPLRGRRTSAVTGAELNARLMILFGICATGATIAVCAAHFVQG
jgi:hypothetical protein